MWHDPFTLGTFMAGSGFLLSGTALALTPRLQKKMCPVFEETYLSDQLFFDQVLKDQKTLKNKEGSLTQVIELEGLEDTPFKEETLTQLFKRRQAFLDHLVKSSVRLKIITWREQVKEGLQNTSSHPVLKDIHTRWMTHFSKSYRNRHFLVLTLYPDMKSFKDRFRSQKKEAQSALLDEVVQEALEHLTDYKARILRNEGETSPLLSFWASLLNGESVGLPPHSDHLSERLVFKTLHFNTREGVITWQEGEKKLYGQIISLNQWGEESSAQILKDLQALEGKLIILQLLKGHPPLKGKLKLEDQRRQKQLLFKSQKVEDEFNAALELIEGGEASLYDYQCSIFLMEESLPLLKERRDEVKAIFRSHGIFPIEETLAIEHFFKSLFPATDLMIRKTHPLSHNLAHLISFKKDALGLIRSDWGEGPLRLFKTLSGSPYALQLHVSEEKEALANSVVIAPSGAGKTTLFQHLIGGALRMPEVRAFIFDRFQGTKIFTESIGGTYVDLKGEAKIPLNPFLLDLTPSNQAFLMHFMELLSNSSDEKSKEDIRKALELLKKVPPQDRILKNLFEGLFSPSSPLQRGLSKWVKGPLSSWFNGESKGQAFDALDLSASPLVTFEMTDILSNPETAATVTTYLFHRIRDVVRASSLPHFIFIDESAPLLENDGFKKYVEVLLKEHRKLRGSIHLCFQDVKDLHASGIASKILGQCPTRFLFPHLSAKREDYEIFDLSDAEWAYIKGESKIHRNFPYTVLLKRPQESVILNIDLRPLGPLLKLYKSGSEPLKKLATLQKMYGDEKWLTEYLKGV